MVYSIDGTLLEVCTCNILCPCWVGEDPDQGTCDSVYSYNIESGQIDGVDVAGRTLAVMIHIPGNILAGNWKVALVIDDGATQEQTDAMVAAFGGKLGGPLAEVAKLIGEVVAVEKAPISFEVKEGKGTLRVGDIAEAEMEPYRSPAGNVTTLNESAFSTIPGAPAWVSKASSFVREGSRFGLADINIEGHNAIQGVFHFEG